MEKRKIIRIQKRWQQKSGQIATNNGETQGKYPDGTAIITVDSILNGIL